jgi:tetratricopeptide (TPR) repeat protein
MASRVIEGCRGLALRITHHSLAGKAEARVRCQRLKLARAVLAIVLLALPWQLFPNEGAILTGRISPPPHVLKLPSDITVTLTLARGNPVTLRVHATGFFEFVEVPFGTWTIRLESSGYETVSVPVEIQGSLVQLDIRLGAPVVQTKTRAGGAQTVLARLLAVPERAKREIKKAERSSKMGSPSEAIHHWNNALRIFHNLPEGYTNLAHEYLRTGNKKEAIAALKESIALDPARPAAHFNLGLIYLEDKDYRGCISHMEQAVSLNPGERRGTEILTECYCLVGEFDKALSSYIVLARMSGHPAMAWMNIGECRMRSGRFAEAEEDFRRFLSLQAVGPQSERAQEFLKELSAALHK